MKTNKTSPIQENNKPIITRKTVTVGEPENDLSILYGVIAFILIIVVSCIIYAKTDLEELKSIRTINLARAETKEIPKISVLLERSFLLSSIIQVKQEKPTYTKKRQYYPKAPNYHVYDEIITREAKKINVNPSVIKAIIEQESHYRPDVYAYERKWELRYSNLFPPRRKDQSLEDYRLNFSSIGLMQIGYAIHKDFCELKSPEDLKDPEINISCGGKLLGRCLDSGSSINECIKKHNGSGPMAENYKHQVLNRVARLMNDLNKIVS